MKKLTREEVLSLPENDPTEYHVRLTKLDEVMPVVHWDGPSALHVQRSVARKNQPPRLAAITPKVCDWAEGCAESVDMEGNIVVESYLMEVFCK